MFNKIMMNLVIIQAVRRNDSHLLFFLPMFLFSYMYSHHVMVCPLDYKHPLASYDIYINLVPYAT